VKGLVPSLRERPFVSVKRLSRSREEACVSALHRAHTSLLPKANKPYSNEEEGRNKAEKELAVADHFLFDVLSANRKMTV
jgi:hypothetical protein